MPVYEEKLISPLAVRFTQDHIREVFRDGKIIEDTIRQIKVKPGTGDYDVILDAPFPNIEIVRWYQKDSDHKEPDTDHWFTLDNRRLYCLQRVAASLWPQRVAAVVELLYTVPASVNRKDDSSTAGRQVNIGHNGKTLFDSWNWRESVGSVCCAAGHGVKCDGDRSPWACDSCRQVMPTVERFRCLECDFDLCKECYAFAPRTIPPRSTDVREVLAAHNIARDDMKTRTGELTDAPATSSMLSMCSTAEYEQSTEASSARSSLSRDELDSCQSASGSSGEASKVKVRDVPSEKNYRKNRRHRRVSTTRPNIN